MRLSSVASDKAKGSFKDTPAKFLNDVNESQKSAGEAQVPLLSGEVTDVHNVMVKPEEAAASFNMLIEFRNETVDSLKEIMRTRL